MAAVGLKFPCIATYSETEDNKPSYASGLNIAKAIKVDVKWNKSNAELYADDALDEVDYSVTGGTISLNVNDLDYAAQAALLGHTYDSATKTLTVSDTDVAPYVGFGFYGKIKRDGAEKFRCVWFAKAVFSEPDDTMETKGENTSFTTPTIEAKLMKAIDGTFKTETIVDTETAAVTWIKTKAAIS